MNEMKVSRGKNKTKLCANRTSAVSCSDSTGKRLSLVTPSFPGLGGRQAGTPPWGGRRGGAAVPAAAGCRALAREGDICVLILLT